MTHTQKAGRLFLAVPITDEVRQALSRHLRKEMKGADLPGRAPRPDNWHITLRFLGEVTQSEYESLVAALREADLGKCFEVVFGSLGAFPRPNRASVLWIGISDEHENLSRLAMMTEKTAVAVGFAPEKRPFHPHLTLSRLKRPQNIGELVKRVPPLSTAMKVEQVVLFRSILRPEGARYEAVDRFPLRADPVLA